MDHLLNTFLHAVAWHGGSIFAHMLGLPIVIVFVVYGIYKFIKQL